MAARCKGPCRKGKGSSGYMCAEDAWMRTLTGCQVAEDLGRKWECFVSWVCLRTEGGG
jgi:hypothetical protein